MRFVGSVLWKGEGWKVMLEGVCVIFTAGVAQVFVILTGCCFSYQTAFVWGETGSGIGAGSLATFFWVKYIYTSSEFSTSFSCSFVTWVSLGWEPKLGTRADRKALFWRSHLYDVAALISIIKLVWWEMMHSVRRINVPFPSPLSVREKMNESSVTGVKEDAGI